MTDCSNNPVIHVVDDDAAFRRSLVFLLESLGWSVLAHASAADFLTACPRPPTDFGCLVLDIRMPGMNGLELQQTLRARGWTPAVVFMTGHGDVELAVQAMKQGAFDFLEKPFRDQALLDAVAAAVRHGDTQRIASQLREQAQTLLARLTPREREVARLVACGHPNKQVARDLDISEKTVHVHRQHVMEKVEVGSAAELARLMLRVDPRALD
ncbi:MAG: response regulator transcription factor [Rhodoferax sp.]|uniref:response regulator transcription factor n=1 Tax=Rhodoferax sp. TaxID=50421 RepID=UPI0017D9D92D|nr:response regulator [Rhodoferax sp.]NMM14543.1 response regulator transcription factor [Rhodoferax sp.]NMM21220.1 response regulator transcription factor [Rhodoferax sp.]